jgi:hypothetical protein
MALTLRAHLRCVNFCYAKICRFLASSLLRTFMYASLLGIVAEQAVLFWRLALTVDEKGGGNPFFNLRVFFS